MNYTVKVPCTPEVGNCTFRATSSAHQTMRSAALQDYNSTRAHDGLPPLTRMPRGTTYSPIVEFVLQGNYGEGWEDLTSEETRRECRAQLRTYQENEGGNYRIVRRAC